MYHKRHIYFGLVSWGQRWHLWKKDHAWRQHLSILVVHCGNIGLRRGWFSLWRLLKTCWEHHWSLVRGITLHGLCLMSFMLCYVVSLQRGARPVGWPHLRFRDVCERSLPWVTAVTEMPLQSGPHWPLHQEHHGPNRRGTPLSAETNGCHIRSGTLNSPAIVQTSNISDKLALKDTCSSTCLALRDWDKADHILWGLWQYQKCLQLLQSNSNDQLSVSTTGQCPTDRIHLVLSPSMNSHAHFQYQTLLQSVQNHSIHKATPKHIRTHSFY